MRPITKIILFCTISLAFISCDRVTKNLAKTHLMNHPDISYLHNTIRLEYAENTGAALSLGDSLPRAASFWLLSMLPLAIMLGLVIYTLKNVDKLNALKMVALALIFAGGMGNLIDRIFFDRHVADFMNVGIAGLRTGIFNVADMAVTAGAICLLIAARDKKTAVEQEAL
ncbi:signal peptidase II [Mucilaginibacter sp. PPCGB 2223]|uniref:signal peptidase II n=1 Tax=Mucilaginibacter sp. PPCGB 2223 TaxID=1886027 RepID=UPI0008244FBE|nr:signal peptidase II [Mucilaginibacter sp. PPCGB 2223]OCX54712.1 signal peptidase II [Mucilaginibacter sp. PPCGB 2223]